MTNRSKILSKPLLIPALAGTVFAGQMALFANLPGMARPTTDQVIINTDAESAMVLTQRRTDPAIFGTIADLWDLQLADDHGEVAGGTFVTAFRQGDLLILRQINGDKKVTVDFSAEHAHVDRGDAAVETYSDIELISSDPTDNFPLLA